MFDSTRILYLQKESWGIREVFKTIISNHPTVREGLIKRISKKEAAKQRLFIASMTGFHEEIEEDLFIAIFESSDPTETDTFSRLFSSIEGLATEKQPVDGNDSSYHMKPFDITSVRKKLFQYASSDTPLSNIANDILNEIDRVRDEYGHPSSEPRHPDINSGKAFPLDAQFIWDAG